MALRPAAGGALHGQDRDLDPLQVPEQRDLGVRSDRTRTSLASVEFSTE
jgi:hypothetical protein